ncbi:MAG: RpiB/LacA/LacB family sugar-phosphate isomerase [bacterium]|nr:RpiB/LacA/LacB family sugar-phosphate isomerase [bacterium]
MKIYLGADHRGFYLKDKVYDYLKSRGYDVEKIGGSDYDPDDDFPVFAKQAVAKIYSSEDADPRAILICGGAQGMGMAANRYKGIRASVVWDAEEAKWTRNDNDSNVLCLPARIFDQETAENELHDTLDTWLETPYANAPRFNRRNKQIDEV